MHSLNLRMALFFAVVLGIAGLCVLSVNHQVKEEMKLPPPRLDYGVAEGFWLWNPKAGVDSVRFDSCRVEKMRMGFFALGGFNVLCIRGLVLNLPLEEEGMRDEGRGMRDEGRGMREERGTRRGEGGPGGAAAEVADGEDGADFEEVLRHQG